MRVVVFGGTSQIGVAIAKELNPDEVVLAARKESKNLDWAITQLGSIKTRLLNFDATRPETHPEIIAEAFSERVDVAIVAFGLLDDAETWRNHAATVRLAQTNYVGALSVGVLLAQQMSAQGGGKIIALSSVAGERVRRSNFVYGSSKAGMDGFYLQLAEVLRDYGVHILVVRPGVVATKMVAGRSHKAFTVTAQLVAKRSVQGLKTKKTMIRVPRIFAVIMWIFKRLPNALVRRIST